MIIEELTGQHIKDFYTFPLSCDSVEGIVGIVDGQVAAILAVCKWEGQPPICVSDFVPGFSKRNLIVFGKEIIRFLDGLDHLVWAVCDDAKARMFTERAGFTLATTEGESSIMSKAPVIGFNFRALAAQLEVPGVPTNSQIIDLIDYGIKTQLVSTLPDLKLSTKRFLCNGMFVKQALVPAKTLMVSKVHKEDCICTVSYGDISIMDQEGTNRITGPSTFLSRAGIKRVGYFHIDTLWTNVHNANGLTDLDEIEESLADDINSAWIHNLLEARAA